MLTRQHVEHINNEEIVESDLGLWYGASGAIELGHHNGQTQPFLVVGLKRGKDHRIRFSKDSPIAFECNLIDMRTM